MIQRRSLLCLILLNLITSILSGVLQKWTYEPIEIKFSSFNTSLADAHVEIVRLRRGEYGISGYATLNFDVYDDVVIHVECTKSLYRDGPYYPTLFNVLNETVSGFINKYYRSLLQSTAAKCCPDCPIFDKPFKPPFKKTHLKIDRCALTTDNMPNFMPTGYYKTSITAYAPFEINLEYMAYLENKVF